MREARAVYNVEGIDLDQGIEGHPELILIAIVDEEGQVILIGKGDQEQIDTDKEAQRE